MVIKEQEYQAELEKQKEIKTHASAADNVKSFYTNNEEYIESCYEYFLQYDSNKTDYVNDVQYDDGDAFQTKLRGKIVLVLTANKYEEGILIHGLVDEAKQKLDFFIINGHGYHVCNINNYTIVHVHAERTGDEYTRRALNFATNIFTPNIIILLGICYGMDDSKNQLGDVFISNRLKTYRINFRDSEKDDNTDYEAEEEFNQSPNSGLMNIIRTVLSYRQMYSILKKTDGSIFSIKWENGIILSSNCLMSSKQVKQKVIQAFGYVKPKPLGGEMEGGGLLKSKIIEEQGFDKWFIMKSICDWGEKKNLLHDDPKISEQMKNKLQAMAMIHTWSVFKEMLWQNCFE